MSGIIAFSEVWNLTKGLGYISHIAEKRKLVLTNLSSSNIFTGKSHVFSTFANFPKATDMHTFVCVSGGKQY